MTKLILVVLLLSGAGVVAGPATASAEDARLSCGEIGAAGLFPNTIVHATSAFAADAKAGLPAFAKSR
jgi:hypothetical protein